MAQGPEAGAVVVVFTIQDIHGGQAQIHAPDGGVIRNRFCQLVSVDSIEVGDKVCRDESGEAFEVVAKETV